MSGPCPLCGVVVPSAQLEVHVNKCLDSQQLQQDEQIAATLGRDDAATEVTVPYRPQQWISVRQPDPESEAAIKRALPPIITTPVPPIPPPAITVALPPIPATPKVETPAAPSPKQKERVVFDADATNGWVDAVRTEIKNKEEFTKSIINSMDSAPAWSKSSQVDRLKLPPIQGDLLDDNTKTQINKSLPSRYRSGTCGLLYSTKKHGISINTFYARVKPAQATILLVEDWNHWVFGAFISEPWKTSSKSFYGTGESFLFTARPKFEVFEWSRINDYFVLNDDTSISIGGGGDGAGLWLDSDFFHGTSKPSGTFLNKVLSSTQDFECLSLEVWGLRAYK